MTFRGTENEYHSPLLRVARATTTTTSSVSSVGSGGSCSGTATRVFAAGDRWVTAEGGGASRAPKHRFSFASGLPSTEPNAAPPAS